MKPSNKPHASVWRDSDAAASVDGVADVAAIGEFSS
jgi:hypothetical protein